MGGGNYIILNSKNFQSWNVNAVVDNSNGAFARRLCNFRSATTRTGMMPAPPPGWPERGVPVECGSNRAVPPRPSLVIHTPTHHQSAPKLQTPNPSSSSSPSILLLFPCSALYWSYISEVMSYLVLQITGLSSQLDHPNWQRLPIQQKNGGKTEKFLNSDDKYINHEFY